MGLADVLAGAFGGLSQGIGDFQKLKNNEADRLTQAKQLRLQELANARADEQNRRQEIEFKRQQAQAFLDAQTDDAEFDMNDPNVQAALEAGLKSSFTAGDGPNKLRIKMTPQRQESALRLRQLELAHKAALRTDQEQQFQVNLKDSILNDIESGTFNQKPIYERQAVLARAGLPTDLAMDPAEAIKYLREQSMVSPSVISAGISAGASKYSTDKNTELWKLGYRTSGSSINDDKVFSAEEYASALNRAVEIIQKTNRGLGATDLYKAAAALLQSQGIVPPNTTPPNPSAKSTQGAIVTREN